jgi:hypothetical protein
LRRAESRVRFQQVKKPVGNPPAWRSWGAAHPFSLLVVFLLAMATVAASSHCELKAVTAPQHSCCAKSEKPHSVPGGYSECCALTAAPMPAPAIVPATVLVETLPALWLVMVFPLDPQWAAASASHPPPEPAHFVSSVLRRSLQAHAPPSFVA